VHREYEQNRAKSPDVVTSHNAIEPGQLSRSSLLHRSEYAIASGLVQRKEVAGADEPGNEDVHKLAAKGIGGTSTTIPFLEQIQRSFGTHNIRNIQAHVGGSAAQACEGMGAKAYATGNHVAFREAPDLHTAAHEAAHIVQQRAGVQLTGGVGKVGDEYERNADDVADAVVQGRSAEPLLGGTGQRNQASEQSKEPESLAHSLAPPLAPRKEANGSSSVQERTDPKSEANASCSKCGSGACECSKPSEISEVQHSFSHDSPAVVQQIGSGPALQLKAERVSPLEGGGHRIAISPELDDAAAAEEHGGSSFSAQSQHGAIRKPVQQMRIPLPRPIPVCGRSLTHIDVEQPRWRDLEPCLPATVPVYRLNIVGRQVTPATTGRGRIIFNLHIGYYRDPATGRYCAIADDSMACIAPRCVRLGCFPTLREVVDAIAEFLWNVLKVIGWIILAILLALILGRLRVPVPGPAAPPLVANNGAGKNPQEGAGTTDNG